MEDEIVKIIIPFETPSSTEWQMPKYVISMDDFPVTTSYKGVKHLKLIDFLTESRL